MTRPIFTVCCADAGSIDIDDARNSVATTFDRSEPMISSPVPLVQSFAARVSDTAGTAARSGRRFGPRADQAFPTLDCSCRLRARLCAERGKRQVKISNAYLFVEFRFASAATRMADAASSQSASMAFTSGLTGKQIFASTMPLNM